MQKFRKFISGLTESSSDKLSALEPDKYQNWLENSNNFGFGKFQVNKGIVYVSATVLAAFSSVVLASERYVNQYSESNDEVDSALYSLDASPVTAAISDFEQRNSQREAEYQEAISEVMQSTVAAIESATTQAIQVSREAIQTIPEAAPVAHEFERVALGSSEIEITPEEVEETQVATIIQEPVAQEIPNPDQIPNPPVRNTMRQATIAPGAIVFQVNADNSLGKRIASFPDGAEGRLDTRDVVLLNDDFYMEIETSRGSCYVQYDNLDLTPLPQQLTPDK